MIELPIGTRFYYNGVLCEVSDRECIHCTNCVIGDEDYKSCKMFVCEKSERKDGMGVFFERVDDLSLLLIRRLRDDRMVSTRLLYRIGRSI